MNSSRATDLLPPISDISQIFCDVVLTRTCQSSFARPFVNSGRPSVPSVFERMPLNGPDVYERPAVTRVGVPRGDVYPRILALGMPEDDHSELLAKRYLGVCEKDVHLLVPDQHVAAGREKWNGPAIAETLRTATIQRALA